MERSWGKVRVGVIASLGAVAFGLSGFIFFSVFGLAPRAYSATVTPKLFVTDACTNAVTAYPVTSNGDVSPLVPAPTGLSSPQFVATDASGKIYVSNNATVNCYGGAGTITIYRKGSNGADAAPIGIIGGYETGLIYPEGIAVDSRGKIYVADRAAASVLIYSAGSNGNVSPIATISGSRTGLVAPEGIAVDSTGKIYVAENYTSSVLVYSAGSKGNVAPIATIRGSNTGLNAPSGIAADSSGKIYVSNFAENAEGPDGGVLVYSAGSDGNVAPIATISGSNTGLATPMGVAVDSGGKIYVADFNADPYVAANFQVYPGRVFVYSAGSDGNVYPVAIIGGSKTGLVYPEGIAVDSGGKIYVVDEYASSVVVYSAEGDGDGAPIATIGGSSTGLLLSQGIAVDSSGKIYVANWGNIVDGGSIAPSLSVYAAGSHGNASPLAIISGSNTGLNQPEGIAVDSRGNIYVADLYGLGGVLVYSAGSTGNVAPVAVISGSNTGLNFPVGIGVDSSGKIYVTEPYTSSVLVYSAGSRGNVAPIANISGSNTGLDAPNGIAFDFSGKIYVTNVTSVTVYPPLGSRTGLLNEAPIATISGSKTGLSGGPQGIAVSSSGKVDVALGNSVLTYPADSNGNVAPIASVNTLLNSLGGIAADSSGEIYVTNNVYSEAFPQALLGSSVLVYSAGSNDNVVPLANIGTTIVTGLSTPGGIASDSSGNIYVTNQGFESPLGIEARVPQRDGLSGGEQRQRCPHRHHQRGRDRPGRPGGHRGGFRRQNLRGGRVRRRVDLLGEKQRQRRPHCHHPRHRPDLPI